MEPQWSLGARSRRVVTGLFIGGVLTFGSGLTVAAGVGSGVPPDVGGSGPVRTSAHLPAGAGNIHYGGVLHYGGVHHDGGSAHR